MKSMLFLNWRGFFGWIFLVANILFLTGFILSNFSGYELYQKIIFIFGGLVFIVLLVVRTVNKYVFEYNKRGFSLKTKYFDFGKNIRYSDVKSYSVLPHQEMTFEFFDKSPLTFDLSNLNPHDFKRMNSEIKSHLTEGEIL